MFCCILRRVYLFFLVSYIFSEPATTSPQYLDKLVLKHGQQYDRQIDAFVLIQQQVNHSIPNIKSDPNIIRIMHYNVNAFENLTKQSNTVEKIRSDIETVIPAIVTFSDVSTAHGPTRKNNTSEDLQRVLAKNGFSHYFFGDVPKFTSGVAIASRIPFHHDFHPLGSSYFFITAIVKLKDFDLLIAVVDFPTKEAILVQKKSQMKAYLSKIVKDYRSPLGVVICGNISPESWNNAVPADDLMLDSFSAVFWKSPTFTSAKGQVVDYILCDRKITSKYLEGSYMFLTRGSTHMPLIVDLKVSGIEGIFEKFVAASASFYYVLASITIVLIISAFGIYHWVKNKFFSY